MGGVALALLLSAFIGATMIRVGPALGFVDRPDGFLKSHEQPAVPLGGIGIFLAVHLGMALEGDFDPGLLAASALLLVLGLVDDRRPLSSVFRLVVEAGAGVVLAVAGDLPAAGGIVGAALVVLLVVVAVNSVNLLDGLDGLAGSSALVSAVGISLLAASATSASPTGSSSQRLWPDSSCGTGLAPACSSATTAHTASRSFWCTGSSARRLLPLSCPS